MNYLNLLKVVIKWLKIVLTTYVKAFIISLKKISHYHPKISFLVQGLKNITKEYYNDYIKALSSVKKKKNIIAL